MKNLVMVFNESACIGCQACVVACRNENNVPDGITRLILNSHMQGTFPDLKANFKRFSCQMCENAPCVDVCPTNASFINEDGVVMVDNHKCIGCNYCIVACPYGARSIDPITHLIQKCDYCYNNRVKDGQDPACVSVCPMDALVFGDLNDKNSKVYEILHDEKLTITYDKVDLDTKPKLATIKDV